MTQSNPPTPVTPLLVDERTAARLLGGLSTRTLFSLRRDAGLPHIRVGARVMYKPADLAAWIDSHKATAGEVAK